MASKDWSYTLDGVSKSVNLSTSDFNSTGWYKYPYSIPFGAMHYSLGDTYGTLLAGGKAGAFLPATNSSGSAGISRSSSTNGPIYWQHFDGDNVYRAFRISYNVSTNKITVENNGGVTSPKIDFYFGNKNGGKTFIGTLDGSTTSASATSDVQDAAIYIHCHASSCSAMKTTSVGSDDYVKICTIKTHTHRSKPSAPTFTNYTGKTITVKGDSTTEQIGIWTGSKYENWKSVNSNKECTFTGLENGTKYRFQSWGSCSCGTDGDYCYSAGAQSAETWKTTIDSSYTSTDTTITISASHNGQADIICGIYTDSAGTNLKQSKTISNAYSGSVTFTGLDPNTTYYCWAHTKGMDDDWSGKLTCKTHKAAPSAPTIDGTTFTKIKVSGGEYVSDDNGTSWKSTGNTFTGYAANSSHTFYAGVKCSTGGSDHYHKSSSTNGHTFSYPEAACTSVGFDNLTLKVVKAPTNGSVAFSTDNDSKYTFNIYKSGSSSVYKTYSAKISGNTTLSHKFSGLESGEKYDWELVCTIKSGGISETYTCGSKVGSSPSIETQTPQTVDINSPFSATTARLESNIGVGSADSVDFSIVVKRGSSTVFSYSRTYYSDSTYVTGITGLAKNTEYTIEITTVAYYSYSYEVNVYDSNGNVTGTTTEWEYWDSTVTASGGFKTKQVTIYDVNSSTKIIEFKVKSNYSTDVLQRRLNTTSYVNADSDGSGYYDDLNHNTSYTIYGRIDGCYAYNSSGNLTTTNDSEETYNISTKLLGLVGSIVEEHQHSIITLWQSKVDGSNCDFDSIDGTAFSFYSIKTEAKKNNPPYQASEVVEGDVVANGRKYRGNNSTTTGDYQTDKKIYSDNLEWYYCEYAIVAAITDGYNVVSATVIAHTTFPYSWVYLNGRWYKAMPHIYTGGQFVPAAGFVYNGGFTEPNGE